jgi:hypothetical protein
MQPYLSSPTEELGCHTGMRFGIVVAFVAVDLILVAVCLFAVRQNVRLRGEVANYVALLTPQNGTAVPPLAGLDWTGTRQTVAYGQDQRPTLVYAFSKECGYCKENWHALRSLQMLALRRVRFVYIDVIGDTFTQQYLAANGIGQSVLLVQLSPEVRYAYEARLMPQVLLVDHSGRVQWSHIGELASSDISKALSLIEHE